MASEAAPEKKNDWLTTKIPGAAAPVKYDFHERAMQIHSQWMVGYEEDEIAAFFEITEVEVKRDLQYLLSKLSPRQVISQTNDRDRIKIQRKQSKDYSRLLDESLKINAKEYMVAGMSPVPAMKEY